LDIYGVFFKLNKYVYGIFIILY